MTWRATPSDSFSRCRTTPRRRRPGHCHCAGGGSPGSRVWGSGTWLQSRTDCCRFGTQSTQAAAVERADQRCACYLSLRPTMEDARLAHTTAAQQSQQQTGAPNNSRTREGLLGRTEAFFLPFSAAFFSMKPPIFSVQALFRLRIRQNICISSLSPPLSVSPFSLCVITSGRRFVCLSHISVFLSLCTPTRIEARNIDIIIFTAVPRDRCQGQPAVHIHMHVHCSPNAS